MKKLDRNVSIGAYVPEEDDDMIICRCEEITKGEIRRAVHDGMYTLTEIRRFLRSGMGLCQGQTCGRLVRGIIAKELGVRYLKSIMPHPELPCGRWRWKYWAMRSSAMRMCMEVESDDKRR